MMIERYLRREDTALARVVNSVCSLRGIEWRNSRFKRGFEFVITFPVGVLSIPVDNVLGVAAKLEDGGSMFFVQERVGRHGELVSIRKIRTMRAGSDSPESALSHMSIYEPENDPRNTRLGQKIRAYEVDEFPQFLQVLKGEISLVDIRCVPQYAIDNIRKKTKRNEIFNEWQEAYLAGKPGVLNLHSAVNKDRKDDLKRYHYDMLYAEKASLGLDLFIIYKTSVRMFRKLGEKYRNCLTEG